MNIIAVNVLWSLGLTAALTWRVSSLLRITENRPAWATYLQWTLALAIFKQLMALFFYTAQTAEIAEIFYILVVFPTGIFFPVAFETVLRFVERPSGILAKLGVFGIVLTVIVACFWGIDEMVLRKPTGVDAYIFDARLKPWAGTLLVVWTIFYGVVTWLALRPVTAPSSRHLLPVMYGYGINLLIIIHDSQVASGALETPFLSGFGNVILAVTFVMSAELALASDLRRMTASDQVEMDELRSRQQFLAGVSAELQKPMLEMVTLRSRLDEYTLDGDTHRLIALFDTASERLKSTLSQLVDFERLTRGEVTLQWAPVHLGPMLHDVLEQGHRLTESAGLRFLVDVDVAEDLVVQGDEERLRQVLINLIANSAKFTLEGQVLFRLRAYTQKDSSKIILRFEVEDTGVGIEDHDQSRIFGAFAQADEGLERRFDGVGLGLAFCGELVRQMGGEIHLESQIARGTAVRVDLGLERSCQPATGNRTG
ncbi:MAG: hypothetical protein CMH58_09750 [Myxococcales bacterium]|nr:hypothetical protein [Myxococcales bacterium]